MKQFNFVLLGWFMSFVLFSFLAGEAEIKVPCFILSGNAETEHSIDIAKLNRITFGDDSMVISSSKGDTGQTVKLLYSLYHHLEIGDAIPTDEISGIDNLSVGSFAQIYFDSTSKHLCLLSTLDTTFEIGVFTISGQLILTSELRDGDAVTLENLVPGIYVAVATDGKNKLNHKFVLN